MIVDSSALLAILFNEPDAKRDEAVYVLHAFQKKSRTTARTDIDLAAKRYKLIGETL